MITRFTQRFIRTVAMSSSKGRNDDRGEVFVRLLVKVKNSAGNWFSSDTLTSQSIWSLSSRLDLELLNSFMRRCKTIRTLRSAFGIDNIRVP